MTTVSSAQGRSPVPSADQPFSKPKKAARILIIAAIALGGASLLAARINPAHMDYISYWSTAKMLVHGGNPYSPAGVFSLEKPLDFLPTRPLIMRNPPWALFLVAPLGFLTPREGLVLWILATGACIVFSVHLLNPRSKDNALALLFAPAIACIGSGQSSAFLLLGFALFLYFHHRRPFLAGAALLLLAFKPHLFLIFWVVLLAESIYRRRFIILAGLAAGLVVATAFAMAIDIRIWPDYFAMLRLADLSHKALPTASMLLRVMIKPGAFWLTFVPSALAIPWGIWYFLRNRETWSWTTHGMLLMLVTIAVSPYGFITDETVLLPAIIFALNVRQRRRYSGWILLAINGIAIVVYTAAKSPLTTPVLIWTPTAWLLWFLYATRNPIRSDEFSVTDPQLMQWTKGSTT